MPHIEVYSTPNCPYCVQAKLILQSKNFSFKEIDVSNNIDSLKKMIQLSGLRSVPQIFINNESIGSYDELAQINAEGSLPHMDS